MKSLPSQRLISPIYSMGGQSSAHYNWDAPHRPSNWANVPKNRKPSRMLNVSPFLHVVPEPEVPAFDLLTFVKETK